MWINLHTTRLHSKYSLPTLVHHEALPGHVWQGEYAQQLPVIRAIWRSTPTPKAGRSMPKRWATSWAPTMAIRSASSAISSQSPSALAAWWSIPGCIPAAGRASRRSAGSPRPTDRGSTR
jgi:hypothetical protein